MTDFLFVTSNDYKVQLARLVCDQFGISFKHQQHDLVEIQADNGEVIAIDKALQAFEVYNQPVAITDDSWSIPGLKGFPGPYMKHINQWFTANDFVRLTKDLKDRRISMRHIIVYRDAQVEKVFSVDIAGTLLKEVRGQSKIPHFNVISVDSGRNSVAEVEAIKAGSAFAKQPNAWHGFCSWFSNR